MDFVYQVLKLHSCLRHLFGNRAAINVAQEISFGGIEVMPCLACNRQMADREWWRLYNG
jgi:hypothetical protein